MERRKLVGEGRAESSGQQDSGAGPLLQKNEQLSPIEDSSPLGGKEVH